MPIPTTEPVDNTVDDCHGSCDPGLPGSGGVRVDPGRSVSGFDEAIVSVTGVVPSFASVTATQQAANRLSIYHVRINFIKAGLKMQQLMLIMSRYKNKASYMNKPSYC